MKKKITEQKWYPYAVAACIAVTLYVLLVHLSTITAGIGTFLGYFKTVVIGAILAYIINPLAKLLQRKFFSGMFNGKLSWTVSIAVSIIIILLAIGFLLGALVPQLVNSVKTLLSNMDSYLASLKALTDRIGLSETLNIDRFISGSGGIMSTLQSYLSSNADNIVDAGAAAGRSVVTWVIALILSVYFLSAKDSIKAGLLRLMNALFNKKRLNTVLHFLSRCDDILVRYIVYSLLDAMLVGTLNFIFMLATGMQYAGLISLIVGVTNLIPTFGPIIGGTIGAFILLLVKPMHALIFIIFTFVLQAVDPYIIKPRLFGNSLGVPGLLILVSIIVFGNMFGIVGILFAIPIAAILEFVYKEALLPWLERRAAARRASET